MATTTWTAIRDIMVAQVRAITPDKHTNIPFVKDRGERDFREWSAENNGPAPRSFGVSHLFEFEPIQISDNTSILEPAQIEVVVAYPDKWPENDRDELDVIIEEDRQAIDKVLGYSATAFSDSCTINPIFSVERDDENVWFLVLEYTVIYHRSVS